MEGVPKQFNTPQEEIAYLRAQIQSREKELSVQSAESGPTDIEAVAKQELREYGAFTPKMVLDPSYQIAEEEHASKVEQVTVSQSPVEDILLLAQEKGIKNALSVLEKVDNAYVIDEVHRHLIELIRSGVPINDLKEDVPPWHIMHLTLFEVTLPELKASNDREYQLAELVGMMEQLFAGLRTIGSKVRHNHFALEIAVADNSDDIVFYVAVPEQFISLFEKLTLSLFPNAVLVEQVHDYNIFVDGGKNIVADVTLKKHPIYPLKTHDDFVSDPLAVLLNAFSKIEREGGGAAVQFVIRHPQKDYYKNYHDIISRSEKGMKIGESISRSTLGGEIMAGIGDFFFTKKKEEEEHRSPEVDQTALEHFRNKISSALFEVNMRIAVSARTSHRADQIFEEITSTLNQFEKVGGNTFVVKKHKGTALALAEKAFSFRETSDKTMLPLSLTELSTLVHFPGNGINSSPQFKQSHANTAAAPTDIPIEGTLLGINKHRNIERQIFSSESDRMRHFYVVGQTGTGKSVFLQNLIVQDIKAGHGVCMIDPHGTDIEEVLGAIPPERADDVIYFDPSNLDNPIGLNMLEYDRHKPEQKTFVVNELFSIFQKLYGANPESMGPMFEQYFRNATLLVMDDPDSGNTLMDISRVMADAKYRKMKLEKATNPVVVQFWREIASKAGGEASLENIVPYIVSKFDVFTANDYMRPIIGQQNSAFNFRQVMDERKILLVNLSKGRLGDINANLIGMIMVGKILMAALSRVDDPTKSFPPFYLHIDEFQNVSTPAIASILSEARKYKLSLTMAHQFIAQLDEKIKDAVFGNVGSLASFRVGSDDAQFLEHQFSPIFTANDLMNVPNYNAFVRILANGVPMKPFSVATMPPPASDPSQVAFIKQKSLERYGRPRAEVEAEIAARYVKEVPVLPELGGIL
ncbi:MAG: type IV secretory system conjugative DNA transfer family protein [Candidatus Paceibacteria bacterium]